jgi:hypothetical protein
MNTGFGLFNLAVAIRSMRPGNEQEHQELPADERLLAPIDYSLLADLPVDAKKVAETVAPTFSVAGAVRRIWVSRRRRMLLAVQCISDDVLNS